MGEIIGAFLLGMSIVWFAHIVTTEREEVEVMDIVIEPGDILVMPFGSLYAIIEDGNNLNIVDITEGRQVKSAPKGQTLYTLGAIKLIKKGKYNIEEVK